MLPKPIWENMVSDLNKPTVLLAEVVGRTAFAGGGCVKFNVLNTADTNCNQFHLEINIRPSWGTLLKTTDGKFNYQQLTPVEINEEKGELSASTHMTEVHVLPLDWSLSCGGTLLPQINVHCLSLAGWFKLASKENVNIGPGMVDDSASICISNYAQAKYLPADFSSYVVAYATCVAGPAANAEGAVLNPNEVTVTPPLAPATPVAIPPDVPAPPIVIDPPTIGTPPTNPGAPSLSHGMHT
jgi:hypothetical protein